MFKTLTGVGFIALFSNVINIIIALFRNSYAARISDFYLGKVTEEG
jgi:hypothetical protein